MLSKLLRFGRRQLHTIVSRDIIKPSSPTPSHLKTYNLSLFDQLAVNAYIPIVAFYPSSNSYQSSHDKTLELKKSLSHTLSQYYPFAGRFAKSWPTHVDCNDEGVDFIEAYNDNTLSNFLQHSEHEDQDQLFPDDLVWLKPNPKGHIGDQNGSGITTPLFVQVNHFSCGGVAVAASLSHKIGDASSCLNFYNYWATVTRGDHHDLSRINPIFIPYKTRKVNIPTNMRNRSQGDYITRSFVFPNSKINELKAKIGNMTKESGEPIMNPTRAEALTWLIHNSAVTAALKTNSGVFKPTGVCHALNLRNNLVESLPETSVGNLYLAMEFPTKNEIELTPNHIIGELRKRKKEFGSIRNAETALGMVAEMCSDHTNILVETSNRLDDYYIYSVVSRFPTYGIDFGWGKPINVAFGSLIKNFTAMLDTPNGDGIEALVSLTRQDMKIFQNDPQLLAFC